MAIGIWTPAELSGRTVVFGERLNTFANKLQSVVLPAGTHMKFTVMKGHPVFIHAAAPIDDAAGFTGTAISCHNDVVMPRLATVYIYSPYDNTTVHVSTGVLT